jgi:hypothetical protein
MSGQFRYNSELAGGRVPFWIRDDALAELDLAPGDAVGVDPSEEPSDGALVLAEVVLDDEASERMVRRYFEADGRVTLQAANPSHADIQADSERVFVVGVVKTRVHFGPAEGDQTRIVEEPLEEPPTRPV